MSEERNIRLRADIKRALVMATIRHGLDASDIASRAIRKGRNGGLKGVVVEVPKGKTATIPVRFRLDDNVKDASDDELRDSLARYLELNKVANFEPIKTPEYEEGIDDLVKPWRDGR